MVIDYTQIRGLTTAQAASKLGVSKNSLLRWLYCGWLKEPRRVKFGKTTWRIWTDADIARAKKLQGTIKPGRKPRAK